MKCKSPKHKIEIVSPGAGSEVSGVVEIRGTVKPPHATVQVLVLANDGMWYQQKIPTQHGKIWRCTVQVGDLLDPKAPDYVIAALEGKRIEGPEPISMLPKHLHTAFINVKRKRNLI